MCASRSRVPAKPIERRVGDMAQHAVEVGAVGGERAEVDRAARIDKTIEHARPRGFGLRFVRRRHRGRRDHGGATAECGEAQRDQNAPNHRTPWRSASAAARERPFRNLIGNTATSPVTRPASGCHRPCDVAIGCSR